MSNYLIESISVPIKDFVIFTFNKGTYLKMENLENDLDIYYVVGNVNTRRQENEIAAIKKKRNSAG